MFQSSDIGSRRVDRDRLDCVRSVALFGQIGSSPIIVRFEKAIIRSSPFRPTLSYSSLGIVVAIGGVATMRIGCVTVVAAIGAHVSKYKAASPIEQPRG